MNNPVYLLINNLGFAIILICSAFITGCSLFNNNDPSIEDPGPIAPAYDIQFKQMNRKDYLVCCGDTLTTRSEFLYNERELLSRYEFYNNNNINTLFNTYTYTDEDNRVDILKRFLTQTDTGQPALTDSVKFNYNEEGQLTDLISYSAPSGDLISLTISYSYDQNGRLKSVRRGMSKRAEYFYGDRGNLVKVENFLVDQETGEFRLNRIETFRYSEQIKNPFFRRQLTGLVFVLALHRSLSPYALIEFNNFNTQTDDPVAGGTVEYEINEDGFPSKSRLIFQNFDGVSQGTVVETRFTY